MKNLKTKTTLLAALFMLSIISINAQLTPPKTTTIKNIELKKETQYKDLKYSIASIDGIIGELLDGRYQIYWTKNSGVVCCFKTVKEVVYAYPKRNLKYATGGNQGFVYQETANSGIGKRIPNAKIAFKNANSTVVHFVHADKNGNYKIGLLPGKYLVTIKRKGYKSYSTAPGFTVINKKFSTFNFPLQKISKVFYKKLTIL